MPLSNRSESALNSAYNDAVSKRFDVLVANLITLHPDDHNKAQEQFVRGMKAVNDAYEFARMKAAPDA